MAPKDARGDPKRLHGLGYGLGRAEAVPACEEVNELARPEVEVGLRVHVREVVVRVPDLVDTRWRERHTQTKAAKDRRREVGAPDVGDATLDGLREQRGPERVVRVDRRLRVVPAPLASPADPRATPAARGTAVPGAATTGVVPSKSKGSGRVSRKTAST